MVDEITKRYLAKQRVRGAPTTVPGAAGLIGSYGCKEIQRQTTRALALPLDRNFALEELRSGQQRLAQLAMAQRLRSIEAPLVALHGDPVENSPHEWKWELVLPVRGEAKAAEPVVVTRVHGGSYIETLTSGGFGDLLNLYTYVLGELMPKRKQQLTRPCIYHRVLDGLGGDDPAKLTLAVFIPYQLSLKAPVRLVTRRLLG